jgi:hypothetical protein
MCPTLTLMEIHPKNILEAPLTGEILSFRYGAAILLCTLLSPDDNIVSAHFSFHATGITREYSDLLFIYKK